MSIHVAIWLGLHPDFDPDRHLGLLADIFRSDDPRPAKEQANDRYRHGGGWHNQPRWTFNRETKEMVFPGDAPLMPLAITILPKTKEIVALYPHDYIAIVQADGTFEMCRMD
jgi:hypothetical protein